MSPIELSIAPINIPFKLAFSHASAERRHTQAVLVTARDNKGVRGYGEGCPREYVTGESMESAMAFFHRHRLAAAELTDVDALRHYLARHVEDIDANPAAWCAMELALLDLLARQHGQSLEALLGLPELRGTFHYSAVLGTDNSKVFAQLLAMYLDRGMTDLKVKLTGDLEIDKKKAALLQQHTDRSLQIRFDANNTWDRVEVAADYLATLDCPFWAVEEPLTSNRYTDLAALSQRLQTSIILDESFLRIQQFDILAAEPGTWIINLRVSKMGGLMRSLAIIEAARARGISLVVGAQVGETSILTRAGLLVAQVAGDGLLAQEGAFGTYLLEYDLCEPSLMFGKRGELAIEASSLNMNNGCGLHIIEKT